MTNNPLPLVFSFRSHIHGAGFLAIVSMAGKALLECEDGEFWVSGIAPAGIAGGGCERSEALFDFRRNYETVLMDIAADANDFGEFKRACDSFLEVQLAHLCKAWDEALDFVRTHDHEEPGLRRVALKDHRVAFEVKEIRPECSRPTENEFEEGLAVVTRTAA